MAKKLTGWKTKGMSRDLSVSAFNPEFAFENMNLRLSTNESNTLMSLVNEKGTLNMTTSQEILGTPVGTAVINHQLIIFTTEEYQETVEGAQTIGKVTGAVPITGSKTLDDIVNSNIVRTFTASQVKDRVSALTGSSVAPGVAVIREEALYDSADNDTAGSRPGGTIFDDEDIIIGGDVSESHETSTAPSTTPSTPSTTTETTYTDTIHIDRIYKAVFSNSKKSSMTVTLLFSGNLGLSVEYPIETLVSYESESIQKVYWTDGHNQPRLINIAREDIESNDNTQFDFVPTLKLGETVKVAKKIGVGGQFPAGVIQYAFTYYRKHGQESAIFYTTPLYYISPKDRGAAPDEKVDNAFQITVEGLDTKFEYLRIYSIQRTSINATPLAKRIQDIYIKDIKLKDGKYSTTYIDNGSSGDSIDPTELLYKGGEVISCYTMKDKDGTLFLGNLNLKRDSLNNLKSTIQNSDNYTLTPGIRNFYAVKTSDDNYKYANQLTAYEDQNMDESVPCGGFKYGDVYRCGVQFQHESGKWSDPIFLKDVLIKNVSRPKTDDNNCGIVTIPVINGSISESVVTTLRDGYNYKKVRPVVVYPEYQDRNIICQGVLDKTLLNYSIDALTDTTDTSRKNKYQSSWFFRPILKTYNAVNSDDHITVSPSFGALNTVPYISDGSSAPSLDSFRKAEIQGGFDANSFLIVSTNLMTLHTPDAAFDSLLDVNTFDNVQAYKVGEAVFKKTFSDINIQTESPTISSRGGGFVHKSFIKNGSYGIVSGLFYDDFIVDDFEKEDGSVGYQYHPDEQAAVKWLVYPWQKTGSLNNDVNRPASAGTASAILKKKVISNLRYADTNYSSNGSAVEIKAQLFASEDLSILKEGNDIYFGNIDTSIIPSKGEGIYLCADNITQPSGAGALFTRSQFGTSTVPFNSEIWWKLGANLSTDNGTSYVRKGMHKLNTSTTPNSWSYNGFDKDKVGNHSEDLVIKKGQVRMKYKSTPHLLLSGTNVSTNFNDSSISRAFGLNIAELSKTVIESTRFGGTSSDALRENDWIPCGKPVSLDGTNVINGKVSFQYSWGDTYYQRYDCMKTYPFTKEDLNQIVEIGSFMLETRCNIDGRYDKNRGQQSNINMSPVNFNLFNPVYNQIDNFFIYKIKDESYYTDTEYPNQITWTLTKQSGADVDAWTHITLASVLEMDGSKGSINSLQKLNDQLICFQNSSVSQVLYNENTQISTTEGVPIEIANSGKVQGKRTISGSVGCSNKWSIANTPSGIYFIDGNEKNIYLFDGQLSNLSVAKGINTWSKQNIPAAELLWTPTHFQNFVTYYDRDNQEVMFINNKIALNYSEKLSAFTGFFAYGKTPYFASVDDAGIWLRDNKIWKHQGGEYCDFFGTMRPYWTILIGNPEPQLDKIFTNLDFRACVEDDGEYDKSTGRFIPTLPFDFLEVWNEYQHGVAFLENKNGNDAMVHHKEDRTASLKRKFRIWRCDIPRDNVGTKRNTDVIDPFSIEFDDTFHPDYSTEARPMERMRNPWLYMKLMKKSSETMDKVEIHDLMMTYYM